MNYNLFINYYVDKNPARQEELDFCFLSNLQNDTISNVVVILNKIDYEYLHANYQPYLTKIHAVIQEIRPTYNDFFQITQVYFNGENNINAITNSDIIVPADTFIMAGQYLLSTSHCLALSRWDITYRENYAGNSTIFARADSQDTWIFKGGAKTIIGADFTMGIAGCDNSIAHYLQSVGYVVSNPCSQLRTYHLHLTNIRNYIQGEVIQRIPPPYHLVQPT